MRSVDFADHLRASASSFDPPVRSLMDVDFYKFTMGQFIFRRYRDVEVVFKLIVRDPTIPISTMVDESMLRKCLDYVRDLRFKKTDLYYLRGQDLYELNMFSEDYLAFLKNLQLPPYSLKKGDGGYELTFIGSWAEVTYWETIALAIISELYYRAVLKNVSKHVLEMTYVRAMDKLFTKLEQMQGYPRIRFADFGQRRRHSFLWQEWAIGMCKQMMGAQFTGTSNTWMAFKHDLDAIGTNAHELPMVLTALADSEDEMRNAQYVVPKLWQEDYRGGLRIMLPDTYGSVQYFAGAPAWLAEWRGQRQDSGDPIKEGERYMRWLAMHGADPKERISIFSDGLDVGPMFKIDGHFGNRHPHPYGWGTMLTNDFTNCQTGNPNLRPFSMVCKVVAANGRPCVKLSNNPTKATGPKEEVERYKRIFGTEGHVIEKVAV